LGEAVRFKGGVGGAESLVGGGELRAGKVAGVSEGGAGGQVASIAGGESERCF